ncbi:uncharacterized protein F5891DRAFT_1021662 [Suillus fuscotomentosus]|uniref:Uncharacterized protein n=1 Tax=Suillus fuscotomentosus TaxID=1912939 RepID=A0AAD4EAV0_9AGAM|nr:uncharacterized protein F5891DRAFT_1021662 [Suillus fuscotomentosus]KAG1902888.1 hypothetical protein F5891DRAFT_1021662 [Suillus fuscotomentosus]
MLFPGDFSIPLIELAFLCAFLLYVSCRPYPNTRIIPSSPWPLARLLVVRPSGGHKVIGVGFAIPKPSCVNIL